MAIFGGAAARARVAPTATILGPIRDASASTSSASRSVLGAGPRRALRRVGSGASRAPSTRASATPSTDGGGGGGTRASRRRERRALAKGEKSHLPDDHPNGGSRAVDAKRGPAPTGALVVDARGVAVGRDGAAPNAGSDQTAEAQTPDEARHQPASDVGVTASQEKRRRTNATRRGDVSSNAPGRGGVCPRSFACVASRRRGFGKRHRYRWVALDVFLRARSVHRVRTETRRRARVAARRALERESANRRALAASARVLPEPADASARGALGRRRRRRGRRRRRHVRTRHGNDRERRLRRFTRRCTKRCTRRETKRRRGAFSWRARSARRRRRGGRRGGVDRRGRIRRNVLADVRRFLLSPGRVGRDRARVWRGRFDPATAPAEEWARFGGHYFSCPLWKWRRARGAPRWRWPSPGTPRAARTSPRLKTRRRRRRRDRGEPGGAAACGGGGGGGGCHRCRRTPAEPRKESTKRVAEGARAARIGDAPGQDPRARPRRAVAVVGAR